MSLKISLFLAAVCLLITQVYTQNHLKEFFSWKTLDFDFPNEDTRTDAIESGAFIKGNSLILGVERWKDKLFITTPRSWKPGVPSTLNYVSLKESRVNSSPNLKPYPNYAINNIHNTNGPNGNGPKIISVFRINVDVCDRLWMVDTGLADIGGEKKVISTPRIIIIDLTTDRIIREHIISKEAIAEKSFFANILVDTNRDNCASSFAYIPDLGGFQLIVYDLEKDESYKVTHHYFYFDPMSGNYNVGGLNFQWTDGVFGVALSPVQKDGYRTLYFHPLSSTKEFAVSTKILQNKTIASDSYYEFKVLGTRGPNSQAGAASLDEKTGILFYSQINKNGVGCWNSYHAKEYSEDTNDLVGTDDKTLVFPSEVKVDKEDILWVVSDKMPVFTRRGFNQNEVNQRIFRTPVSEAVKGTKCEPLLKDVSLRSGGRKVEVTTKGKEDQYDAEQPFIFAS
ncbi:hypothetical protein WDU94_002973 [Cyamophila willieti]